MGGKHASTASTGLTPGMKGVRVGGNKSPDDSNKENIPPGRRRSERHTPAKRDLFGAKEEKQPDERRGKSRQRRSVSPQKKRSASPTKNTPRKRTASATGDKLREEASPSKKENTTRSKRNASVVASVRIRNQSDVITPTQPPTQATRVQPTRGHQTKPVLEFDNVDLTKPLSAPRPKGQQQQQKQHTEQQKKAWRGIGDTDAEDSEEEDKQWDRTTAPRAAAGASAATPRRSRRLGSVGRDEREEHVEDLSPSKELIDFEALSMTTPRKREARTPPRGTPSRTTVSNKVDEARETTRRTPTRAAAAAAAAAAKKMTFTPREEIVAPMARLPKVTITLKKVSTGAGEETWAKKTGKTPRTEGMPPPRVARIAKQDKDASYEPEDVRMQESESDEDGESSSESEAEEEEEGEEERTRRPSRGRGGPTAAGGRSVSRARAAPAARADVKKTKFRMEVEGDDDEPMDMSTPPSNLAAALDRLAVYRCPRGTLLCREQECGQIREFIKTAISPNGISQACYISGVPGTGKTASVMAMVKELQSSKKCPAFVFIKVNAMYYTDPKQVFSEILYEYERKVRGTEENVRRLSGVAARKRLNTLFERVDRDRPPVLLLVDELDQLSTKKQELIYDVFNWSSVEAARVSIISIANTLDLPERMLNQRICSRLGMNRIVFQPYTHAEIEQIVVAKLGGTAAGGGRDDAIIDPSVIEIAARKVAAISGDLRKATDILRTAIEAAIRKGEEKLTFPQVQEAIRAASETLLVLAVRSLSRHQMILFEAAVDIVRTRDVVDFSMGELVDKYEAVARLSYDVEPINYHGVCRILLQLSSLGLVRASNPNERAIYRRRLRLLPAVHDATSALKIVSARRAVEKSTTVAQP